MASLWCLTLLMLTSACATAENGLQAPGYSEAFLKLLNVLNGKFTDQREVDAYKNIDDPDLEIPFHLLVVSMPVEVPALAPAVTYFIEEYYEKSLLRRLIGVLWEDENGEIYLQPHNITSPSNDLSKPFSLDQIKKLTASDLTTREECKVKFQRKGTQTFIALWPDCTFSENGIAPNYHQTWSCNAVVGIALNPRQVEYAPTPMIYVREGPRYPFPPYLSEANDKVTCE